MIVCPACHWQNEATSGPCAGCGRELAAARAPGGGVPPPRGVPDGAVPPGRFPAPAPPPAMRDIPVVVAPAARPAVRFRGNGVDPSVGNGASALPERVLPGPGARMCPSCGAAVDAGRRFCRCGAQLSRVAETGADPSAVALGWSRPSFLRAQRAANRGRRVGYDAPLAGRVQVLRALLVALLVLAVVSQAPPWGADVRHWMGTRIEQAVSGR